MSDLNIPQVPDMPPVSETAARRFQWGAWTLAAIVAVFTPVAVLVPDPYKSILISVLGAMGTLGILLSRGIRTAAPPVAMLLGLLLFSGSAGCNPYGAAWKGTGGVMYAVQATSKGLAVAGRVDHAQCLATHGAKTAGYMTCINSTHKRLVAYRDNARPAARSVVAATWSGILIAAEAGKKEIDYIAMLKPGACALILGLREWGHKLPDKGATILPYLALFTGMACDAPSAGALAVLVALLPVAVDLVKWVVHIIGAPNEVIQAEILAWIKAPPSDEVDALIRDINAAMPGGA